MRVDLRTEPHTLLDDLDLGMCPLCQQRAAIWETDLAVTFIHRVERYPDGRWVMLDGCVAHGTAGWYWYKDGHMGHNDGAPPEPPKPKRGKKNATVEV